MALIANVDDSRLARTFTSASLRQAGHEVVEIEPTNLQEVIIKLRALSPALLILDQQMPNFSGSSLVRACFEDDTLASLKVVMLTAHHNGNLESCMEKLGVHAVLHKPITPMDLNKHISELLNL